MISDFDLVFTLTKLISGTRCSLRETQVYDQISKEVEEECKPPKVINAITE